MKLVTGAGGFVGGTLVEQLLARGDAVRALVRRPEQAERLRARGVEVVLGDVLDPAAVEQAVRGVAIVHHCAAAAGARVSARDILRVNLDGTRNVLEAARRAGVGRFVFVSSINVLGTCDLDPATEDLPYRRSSDPAADVKIDAERLVLDAHRQHGQGVVIVRPGFIYGPGDPHNIPRLAGAILKNGFAFIGSRDNVVPIIHVTDVARALVLAGTVPAANGRVYNLGDGTRTTIAEFVGELADLLGRPRPQTLVWYLWPGLGVWLFDWLAFLRLYWGPTPISRPALRFVGTSRYVDITRARQELGFVPQVDYKAGLPGAVRYFQEHQGHPVVTAVPSPAEGS